MTPCLLLFYTSGPQAEQAEYAVTPHVISHNITGQMLYVSHKDAAWEACDDIERLCVERIHSFVRSVERKRSEMREKVGEAEKAAVDWTNSHLGKLEREVLELRRREDELEQLSLTEDPIQFVKVMTWKCIPFCV